MPPDRRRDPGGDTAPRQGPSVETPHDTLTVTVQAGTPGTLLTAALGYAARGWPVFPCSPGSKEPAIPSAHPEGDPARGICTGECGRDGHGFHDATTSPDHIRAWWRARPGRNVAIATGAPGPDVLDVDVKADVNGFAALGKLQRAGLLTGAGLLVRTPSGGLHLYFAGTSQECGRLPEHGLDFKARGGYVLAPPSVIGQRLYELAEERDLRAAHNWATDRKLLRPPRPFSAPRPPGRNGDISHLVEWVARREPGDRNHPLYWAAKQAALAGRLDADAVELFVDAAARAGLAGGEIEARRTIASASRKAGQ